LENCRFDAILSSSEPITRPPESPGLERALATIADPISKARFLIDAAHAVARQQFPCQGFDLPSGGVEE